ncbi:MAG TPA: hypothetical protein VMM78_17815, partial [Thermomicrobiales bacterium]|nr:hypothetical protein [Thermomicrobiales bacterium]
MSDRKARDRDGVCFVEGIRQVVSALETGHRLEAVIIDPTRLRSDVAKETIAGASDLIEHYVTLTASEFERISSRD